MDWNDSSSKFALKPYYKISYQINNSIKNNMSNNIEFSRKGN